MAKSQIIKDIALDNISLESALHRLLVITYSLKNEELRLWIERELNGYSEEHTIPNYRKNISYMILYTGFNASTQVTNQPLSESYFTKEIREILENRVILDGINTVEEILKKDREPSYNLIECAGMVNKNSNGYIKCVRLEQVLSRTNFSELISNVKFRIIEILLDLEQQFGVLDNLDIDTSDKTKDELSKVNAEITRKLYFDGSSGEFF
ncbi:hypothetical protein CCE06_08595 [Streptococcus agalactiae]|uniref:AbiTii domain-containing protein n=1 Tax=Streptococcus agalactiae TaxID=1311 RepID=UPI000BA84C05|nr:hypothetical protein [Streptococcus agalactiae]PAO73875.1 hypothetical protein CCE06_08595 [Streptococcus agalactiae]